MRQVLGTLKVVQAHSKQPDSGCFECAWTTLSVPRTWRMIMTLCGIQTPNTFAAASPLSSLMLFIGCWLGLVNAVTATDSSNCYRTRNLQHILTMGALQGAGAMTSKTWLDRWVATMDSAPLKSVHLNCRDYSIQPNLLAFFSKLVVYFVFRLCLSIGLSKFRWTHMILTIYWTIEIVFFVGLKGDRGQGCRKIGCIWAMY